MHKINIENLLAIVIDRLQLSQTGSSACRENALAIIKIEEALHLLNQRIDKRVIRSIGGLDQN
jgi:hypothetical protein